MKNYLLKILTISFAVLVLQACDVKDSAKEPIKESAKNSSAKQDSSKDSIKSADTIDSEQGSKDATKKEIKTEEDRINAYIEKIDELKRIKYDRQVKEGTVKKVIRPVANDFNKPMKVLEIVDIKHFLKDEEALKKKGQVTVELAVDKDGLVLTARIVKDETNDLKVKEAALMAASYTTYEPIDNPRMASISYDL